MQSLKVNPFINKACTCMGYSLSFYQFFFFWGPKHHNLWIFFSLSRCIFKAKKVIFFNRVTASYVLNKTLGRALDPRANGTWLSKLTE